MIVDGKYGILAYWKSSKSWIYQTLRCSPHAVVRIGSMEAENVSGEASTLEIDWWTKIISTCLRTFTLQTLFCMTTFDTPTKG